VTAVDAAPEVLDINRARHGGQRVTHVLADLFSWTPPRRFDAVCFGFWVSHVPAARWASFWALVDHALAPGGRVWFCDSAHPRHSGARGPRAGRGRGDQGDVAGELSGPGAGAGRQLQHVPARPERVEGVAELLGVGAPGIEELLAEVVLGAALPPIVVLAGPRPVVGDLLSEHPVGIHRAQCRTRATIGA